MNNANQNDPSNEVSIDEWLQSIEAFIGTLPGGEKLTQKLRSKVDDIRAVTVDARAPRIMLFGRRGSGKSSLINAIFGEKVCEVGAVTSMTGEATWHNYSNPSGSLEILDTRGVGEFTPPDQADAAVSPIASILKAVSEKAPDCILILHKAKEIDAQIEQELVELRKVYDFIKAKTGVAPLVAGVVTQCDELDPVMWDLRAEPEDEEDREDAKQKADNVRAAESRLRTMLRDKGFAPKFVLGVASNITWSKKDRTKMRQDGRWQIDALERFIFDDLPLEAQVVFVRTTQEKQSKRKLAKYVVNLFCGVSSVVAATPIPIGDVFLLTGLQVTMVVVIGRLNSTGFGKREAAEFITGLGANVAAGIGLRMLAGSLMKFLPAVGTVAGGGINAVIAFGATKAIGEAAIAYFVDHKSVAQAREIFESTKAEAEQEARA